MLPFDAETLYANLGQYNLAIWPAQLVGLGLGLVALGLCLRPKPQGGRAVAAILTASWAWIGIAYHFGHFATINFAAPAFGWIFLLEATALAWTGILRGGMTFRSDARPAVRTGLALVALAALGLPAVDFLAGRTWPGIGLFGTAPDATALATVGILLLAERPARHLAVLPVLWALASGTMAWELDEIQGLVLPIAMLFGFVVLITQAQACGPEPTKTKRGGRP